MEPPQVESIYDYSAIDEFGNEISFADCKAKVTIIVNVSTKDPRSMGYFKKLYMLDSCYAKRGFNLFSFPCNQFNESVETVETIHEFMRKPNLQIGKIFQPIDVNGPRTPDLYKFLKRKQPGKTGSFVSGNFTVFIVDQNGIPVDRVTPPYTIEELKYYVDTMLKAEKEFF